MEEFWVSVYSYPPLAAVDVKMPAIDRLTLKCGSVYCLLQDLLIEVLSS